MDVMKDKTRLESRRNVLHYADDRQNLVEIKAVVRFLLEKINKVVL